MAKNILVISCDIRETRAALIENGIIAELHIERKGRQSSTVGNVYLGKVTRVLPGLQAAFVDIGQERAAFLHVEDLIRPDDFDEYLAGGRNLARKEGVASPEGPEPEDDEEAPLVAAEAPAAVIEAAPESRSELGEAGDELSDEQEVAHADRGGEREESSPELETSSSEAPPSDEPPSDEDERASLAPASEERSSDAPSSDAPSSETRSSVPPMPTRSDDLETTVSYPNWPHPPSARLREGVPSQQHPQHPPNGATDVGTALESDEPGPLDDDLDEDEALDEGSLPPAEMSSIELTVAMSSSVSGAVLPADDESSAELVRADEDRHSFHSAPTLDELPDDDDVASSDRPSTMLDDAGSEDDDDDLPTVGEDDDLPGFTVSEPGEPVPRAPAPRAAERGERGGRRRRGRRRGGGGANEGRSEGRSQARGRGGDPRRDSRDQRSGRSGGGSGDRRGGGRSAQGLPGRISKSTPIREVVKEGQEIIVQVTKDPIGTKGARCSSHISLPGRYVVYLPTVDHIGISKRIGNDKERARLREAIEAMKPPHGGLIVRTVAEGLTKKGLKQDVGYLVRLWGEIAKKRDGARAPLCLSSELDLVLKVARDLFTDEVDEVVIDDRQQYERLRSFVEMFAPDRLKDVKFYDEDEPIFDEYGIEDEIGRALSRKVPLPSGGYLIIDQAEALAAIDVNTGRFVGKGSKDMEETILKTNLEAVHEIAYQLRFRNIGGLIILDLIDMELHKNRETVRRTLEELLQKDKAKTTLNRISELGLIEMTRKRTRESLSRLLHEACFYCDGTGQLQSKETIAYEILREIRRKKSTLPGYSVVVNAHPAVADVLNGNEKQALAEAENRFQRKIMVVPRKEYHLEQFDLQGR